MREKNENSPTLPQRQEARGWLGGVSPAPSPGTHTNDKPNFHVLALDLSGPKPGGWKELVPEGPDPVADLCLVGGNLVLHDWHDVQSLYSILEDKIVPAFYGRDSGNVPTAWLKVMKEAITTIAPTFSAHRQVKEYTERFYIPAMQSARKNG